MFRRLVVENSAALFTLVAFITALTIYVTIAWRALRMKRPQVSRFENLPFETPTPVALRVSAGTVEAATPSRSSRSGPQISVR